LSKFKAGRPGLYDLGFAAAAVIPVIGSFFYPLMGAL